MPRHMADLDWFPFWLRDFDEGTREMTNEDVGAYLRLLYYQWHYGSIPADRERASRVTGERFSDATWTMLQAKFVPDASVPGDRLVNLRMQAERRDAEIRFARRSAANRANGQRGGAARARNLRALAGQEPERVGSESPANRQRSASDPQASGERASSTLNTKKEEKIRLTTEGGSTGKVTDTGKGRARRSRRAPEDYKLSDAMGRWVQEKFERTPTDTLRAWTRKQLEKFRNHEFNSPRSDWDATFRNWVLNCIDRGDVPHGAVAGGDEEKAWQDVLKTAAIFNMTRAPDESREAFAARVNERNQRRLDALNQR